MNTFSGDDRLIQLGRDFFLFKDGCNVYIIRNGETALLIDFGSGRVIEVFEELGIKRVEKVIHTNHHRDMCCGDHLLGAETEIFVPDSEKFLFDEVEQLWGNKRVYVNYREDSIFFSRTTNISCNGIKEGDTICWAHYSFKILETPGDSKGAVSVEAIIDGRRVVFCGDMISEAGKVHNIYDFQWDYMPHRIFAEWLEAIKKVENTKADCLYPSHGSPINNPTEALLLLYKRVDALRVFLNPERRVPGPAYTKVLPHLVFIDSTSYIIISESGKGFLIDFGYVDPLYCLRKLKKDFGLKQLEVITISHYHDDHIARISEMQYRHASSQSVDLEEVIKIWTIEEMADILKNPKNYNIPCLFPSNFDTVVLKSGTKVKWEEFELNFYHMPGQTEFAQGLFADIDGKRVLFSGDNIWITLEGKLLSPTIFKNVMIPDHLRRSAEIMLEMKPDIICTGHNGFTDVEPGMLEGYLDWTAELKKNIYEVVSQQPVLYGIDTRWAVFYPYVAEVLSGEEFKVWLRVRNYYEKDTCFSVELNLPAGFYCEVSRQSAVTPAGGHIDFCFDILTSDTVAPGTKLAITADIDRGGVFCPEAVEFIVEVGKQLPFIL